jgi:hypothetical protein
VRALHFSSSKGERKAPHPMHLLRATSQRSIPEKASTEILTGVSREDRNRNRNLGPCFVLEVGKGGGGHAEGTPIGACDALQHDSELPKERPTASSNDL